MTTDAEVPLWALVSATAAPVLLVGGWTVAAAAQPGGFDAVAGTISDLAALTANDRWIMTTALVGVGLCHMTTALGLRPAATKGRVALALAGLASIGVAATPITAAGTPAAHTATAATAFLSFTLWPLLAARRSTGVPRLLQPKASVAATLTLAAALGWFAFELQTSGNHIGAAERLTAAAQSAWPLAVVLSCRRAQRLRGDAASR